MSLGIGTQILVYFNSAYTWNLYLYLHVPKTLKIGTPKDKIETQKRKQGSWRYTFAIVQLWVHSRNWFQLWSTIFRLSRTNSGVKTGQVGCPHIRFTLFPCYLNRLDPPKLTKLLFEPFWAIFGRFLALQDPFWGHQTPAMGKNRSGCMPPHQVYPFSRQFEPFGSVQTHKTAIWALLGHFGQFWAIFGPFLGHLGPILGMSKIHKLVPSD